MLATILIIVLVLLLIGAFPRWNYNHRWGYAPFGLLTTLLIILVILWFLGKI